MFCLIIVIYFWLFYLNRGHICKEIIKNLLCAILLINYNRYTLCRSENIYMRNALKNNFLKKFGL